MTTTARERILYLMRKEEKHPLQSFVANFAIFTAAVFIVSYGAVTSYYSGYLDHFGINIRYIDFWPHLPDFMVVAAPMIGAILFVGAAGYGLMLLLSWIGSLISKKFKNKIMRTLGEALQVDKRISLIIIIIALSLGTFNIVYSSQSKDGAEFAATQTKFIRVGADGQKIDLLIYQNGGTAFTKIYDKESKQFENSYKTINFVGQNLVQIDLDKVRL